MRLRNIPGSREEIEKSPFVIHDPALYRGYWADIFPDRAPLRVEIGMGKGRFLMDMAEKHPEVNYIGMEMYSSVLVRAVEKAEQRFGPGFSGDPPADAQPGTAADPALKMPGRNFCFLRMDARELPLCFAPGEIDRIYLNFSDPWPKARHEDRRLTSRRFLKRYEQVLIPNGQIEFKTDNTALFAFSLEEIRSAGWKLAACTYDLHNDPVLSAGNIMTEYEEKFSSQGNPICKLIAERT